MTTESHKIDDETLLDEVILTVYQKHFAQILQKYNVPATDKNIALYFKYFDKVSFPALNEALHQELEKIAKMIASNSST